MVVSDNMDLVAPVLVVSNNMGPIAPVLVVTDNMGPIALVLAVSDNMGPISSVLVMSDNMGPIAPVLVVGYNTAGPWLVPASGDPEAVQQLGLTGPMVSPAFADLTWEVKRAVLPPGGQLWTTTDGLLEARSEDGEFFGEQRGPWSCNQED